MRGTEADLQSAMAEKRHEITLCMDRIDSLKEDIKSCETSLSELEVDLATLERAWSILGGEKLESKNHADQSTQQARPDMRSGSVVELAKQILRTKGEPMNINQMLPLILEKRKSMGLPMVSKEGVAGVLYRAAKRKNAFMHLGRRHFALLGWNQNESESNAMIEDLSEGMK
jgi:hypothetical protein